VAKTKELKKRSWGIEEGEESSRPFWKEPSHASGSLFQRAWVRLTLGLGIRLGSNGEHRPDDAQLR